MTQDKTKSETSSSLGHVEDSSLAMLRGTTVTECPQHLYALLSEAARRYPDRPALISLYQSNHLLPQVNNSCQSGSGSELRWTYAQLFNSANCLAASLYCQGVREGDTVAVFLDNGAEAALLLWASARLKVRFVPLDPRSLSRSSETRHYLAVLKPHVIVVLDGASAQIVDNTASDHIPKAIKIITSDSQTTPILTSWQNFADLVASSNDALVQLPCAEQNLPGLENDIGLIVFTSGTTNLPKACPHTHRNIWYSTNTVIYFRQAKCSDVLLHHLSISHIFGINNLIAFWRVGAAVIFPSARFDAKACLDALVKEEVTQMPSVPSMIQALVDAIARQGIRFKALGNIHLAGTIISPAMLALCIEPSKLAARSVSVGFGLTEGIPIFGWVVPGETIEMENNLASTGKIAPAALAKICAFESRRVLRRGETGELHVGGGMVIHGYLNGNSDAFYRDDEGVQWFVTGDQAKVVDSGAVYVLGRYKDVIIRAGENLSSAAIESCLESLPGIKAPQVVGVQDEYAGEVPVAVVRIDGVPCITHAEMKNFVRSELGFASVPAVILTLQDLGLSALPSTTSGKVKKSVLRQIVQDHLNKNLSAVQVSMAQRHADSEADSKVVWSRLLGLPTEEIPLDTPIKYLGDSITLLQFRSIMKREFGHDIRLDSSDEMTIRSQASSITTAKNNIPPALPSSRRDGPPTVEEMVHVLGEDNGLARTIHAAEPVLKAMGLDWGRDVEDVFPVPDQYTRFRAVSPRPNAWNLRCVMVASDVDVPRFRHALEVSLSRWPLLRALHIDYEGSLPLYCVIRSGIRQFIDRCIEPTDEIVSTAEELKNMVLPAPSYAYPPGPLFRSGIATIQDTGDVGVVIQIFHSAFDGTMWKAWKDDFHNILYHQKESLGDIESNYKHYADAYYLYRNSPLAAASIAFHVNRTRGISKLMGERWPEQRACRWHIGSDAGWKPLPQMAKDVPSTRTPLNPDRTLGAKGIIRTIPLPHIGRIKERHDIPASLVLKTACALFNLYKTGQRTIMFNRIQASRAWPFVPDWISKELPNPMDIAGPTFESFLDMTTIPNDTESVLSLMKRVNLDYLESQKWPHVPQLQVLQQLGEEDSAVFIESRVRQSFNWLHLWQGQDEASSQTRTGLREVEPEWSFDLGVSWNCGLINADTLRMRAMYDDCQLRHEEMIEATDCLLAIAEWIHRSENWERSVADCLAVVRS